MKIALWSILLLGISSTGFAVSQGDIEDNEFAEFEDEEIELPVEQKPQDQFKTVNKEEKPVAFEEDDDYGVVEDEEMEIEEKRDNSPQKDAGPLKFADVPAHFRSNWASYQVEAVVLAILAIYLVNYVIGRGTNQNLAYNWFMAHKDFLEQQFAVVGDDGISEQPSEGNLQRDIDCSFSIWCSGRVGVSGLLIQLKTIKRQDLLSRIIGLFSPSQDKITFKFDLDAGETDSFVFAVGQRKQILKQQKELADLSQYTVEKKNSSIVGLPNSFSLLSEIGEASLAMLDPGVLTLLRKYEDNIHSIHISDQFCGPRLSEGETYTRLPEVSRVAIFSFELREGGDDVRAEEEEMLQMMFYILDKARRFRLSREGKSKADKKRQAVEEQFLKTTHLQRQEAAQARREEKARERKQRLLEEEDPDKQRRLEKMDAKYERKMKQPKMKQLKVR